MAHGRVARTPSSPRWSTRARATTCRCTACRATWTSMRAGLRAGPHAHADDELDDYMEGSAATVGRIMAPLLGAPGGLAEDVARLGVAFQLANFVRDVRVDWAAGPRLPPRPARGRPPRRRRRRARLREQVAREVARARALFAETAGRRAARWRRRCAPASALARAVYGRVLDRVERNGFDVARAPRALRAAGRPTGAVAGALVGARRDDRPGHGPRRASARRWTARAPTSWSAARASAGLAVARELARAARRPRSTCSSSTATRSASAPTSACAAPTPWLHAMGVASAIRRELPYMTFATPHGRVRYRLPWSWSAFDYRELCERAVGAVRRRPLRDGEGRGPRPARRRRRRRAHRPRRPCARRSSSTRWAGGACWPTPHFQPPDAPLSRGLEVHPHARRRAATRSTSGSSARSCAAATAGACRRAARRASASAPTSPRDHVKEPTVRARRRGSTPRPSASRATGSRTACARAVEDGVFCVGDSAGHCFPLSGEGIRTALLLRRRLRARAARACSPARQDRGRGAGALRGLPRRATPAPSAARCALQRLIPALPPRALDAAPARAARPSRSSTARSAGTSTRRTRPSPPARPRPRPARPARDALLKAG